MTYPRINEHRDTHTSYWIRPLDRWDIILMLCVVVWVVRITTWLL